MEQVSIAVLDFLSAEVDIYNKVDVSEETQDEDIEKFLISKYGSTNHIQWMVAENININL